MNYPTDFKRWYETIYKGICLETDTHEYRGFTAFIKLPFDMQAGVLLRYIREEHGVLIYAYRNGSGYLWSMEMDDSGTDLGWSDLSGNHEDSGSFTSYDLALQDAIDLEMRFGCLKSFYDDKSTLKHWSHYSRYLQQQRYEHELEENK